MSDTATLKHRFRDEAFGPSLSHPPYPCFHLPDWTLTPAPLTRTLA